jgi:hypothetical protein
MRFPVTLAAVAAVWGGYQVYSQHHDARVLRDVMASADANGFLDVPPPIDQNADTVYVVAAQNCPHAAAQQADRLAKQLGDKGVSVVRVNQVGYQPQQIDRAMMNRLNVVMNGPLPLVFINGRVASNPEIDRVMAEYERTASTRTSP